jgi:ribosomal protein S12 methylthiotransferase
MKQKTYYLVSLGCAKNTVDSDSMAGLLNNAGYRAVASPGRAGILLVNTCGFIQAARDESLEVLNELASGKKHGQLLIAAGCLTQRYRQLVSEKVAGVDGIIGTRRWMDIIELVEKLRSSDRFSGPYSLPEENDIPSGEPGIRRITIQGPSAYLKIADGCRRPCAFCSIPLIKGPLASRRPDAIYRDASFLQAQGVKEINLIAQDTTDYGHDLGLKDGLATLLEGIVDQTPQIPWIRVLYAYPGYVSDRLINVMAKYPQILHYLDIPLQHAHPQTLKRMKRPFDMEWVRKTIEKMRLILPDLAIRSTFIVGYPGETNTEFNALIDFIQEVKFDHIGVFTFSFEPETASEPLGDPVSAELKQERLEKIMKIQEAVSLSRNQEFIGKTIPVLVEGYNEGISIGRSYRDAPEIDGLVLIEGQAPIGEFVQVQINSALTHDLIGTLK